MHQRIAFDSGVAWFSVVLCIIALTAACGGAEQAQNETTPSGESSTASKVASAVKDAVQGGKEFEGAVTMKMDIPDGKAMEMTYFMKGQHSRIETNMADLPGGQAVMLWDVEAGKMTTLMPSKKMYMTMDMKEMGEGMKKMAEKMKDSSSEKEDDFDFPKITKTNKQETIAGHSCEHWLIGDKQEIDICVAKGLGYFGMGGRFGGDRFGALRALAGNPKLLAAAATHPEWLEFLNGGAFPLKMAMMKDGQPVTTMEVTKIEPKTLDDSLFTVPSDYKELNMKGLMGQ